ncbi:stalk domain-containing protein [Paenibacillus sp. FSL H8-0457]|uniref:stalk domain-containing protein n=1 Tax=Bacillales TaxID=1385 RepID=UPI0001788545|nr:MULTISPECIES: stalk domain-containing protein [unclassified Paenibacillus]ACX66484.1 copper amine oxidase domain protein [Paenibacillus sp. Y412MC10]ETT61085.1 copper amine oxidase domain-containing protein [Paenibacillus sp. FSL H8-457]
MKRTLYVLVLFSMLAGLGFAGTTQDIASADGAELRIQDIAGRNTYLMSDGSMWSLIDGRHAIRTPGNVAAISGYEYGGIGMTQEGRLVEWDIGKGPQVVPGTSGVKQIAGSYWLKSDGTVWAGDEKAKNLSGISLIANADQEFAALSSNGELLLQDNYKKGQFKKLGIVENPAAVKSMTVHSGRVALLHDNGDVVVYETSNFDDNGQIIPVTVAQNAAHIVYASSEPTDLLMVTLQDGTVWTTGEYKDRWKLKEQITGLSGIVKTSIYGDAKDLSEGFYAQRSDGSWVHHKEGQNKNIDVPVVKSLSVAISDATPYVGESLEVSIQETYTNGAKIKVPVKDAGIDIEKPYLLSMQKNGMLKSAGVGKTQITVTSGGQSKSVTVSASLRNNLKYAKQVNGNVMVPAKSVIQALGGTYSAKNGSVEAKFGQTLLSFKAGSNQAKLNESTIRLKAAPVNDKGELLIPASVLSDALGAKTSWDAKWKQAQISLGADAAMTVVSSETAGLIKKAMQGNLVKYIGRTYWVNEFEDLERFSKLTVTDILPDDKGEFNVIFKSASGKTVKSYPMRSSEVTQLFADRSSLLTYDPYKKHKWSASVWKQIKAGQVSLGMTKEQVQLSWGNPAAKDITSGGGKTIETWGYSNFNIVSFVNGKAILIMM